MRCHCDYVLLQYTLLVHVDISGGVGDSYVLAQHSFDVKMVMLSKMLINSLTHCLLHQSLHDLKKQGIYTKDLHGYYHLSTLIHMAGMCTKTPTPSQQGLPTTSYTPIHTECFWDYQESVTCSLLSIKICYRTLCSTLVHMNDHILLKFKKGVVYKVSCL